MQSNIDVLNPSRQAQLLRRRHLNSDETRRLTEIRRLDAQSQSLAARASQASDREFVLEALSRIEEPEVSSETRAAGTHQLYRVSELEAELKWAKELTGETRKMVVNQLEQAKDLGAVRYIAAAPDPAVLCELRRDFPNFEPVLDFIAKRLVLCRMGPAMTFRLPPMLLAGPPGVGKTWFTQKLAMALAGIPYAKADLSQATPAFAITGLDAAYDTGRPGLVWKTLQNRCASPIILFDEVDKVPTGTRDAGIGFLLGLLEKASAARFQDAAMRLPIDVSHVFWFATCNDVHLIDRPVLSRFRIFQIAPPTTAQMRQVVESVNRELLADEDWSSAFDSNLPEQVYPVLTDCTPREIKQRLEDAYACAALANRCYLIADDLTLSTSLSGSSQVKPMPIGFVDTNGRL